MIFTDTHAHVYSEEFASDSDECFKRSIQNQVTRVFVPNVDLQTLPALKSICNQYPKNYFPMMGLHPCSVKEEYEAELELIHKELISNTYYAVGEIGMDLYWDKSTFDIQKKAFIQQSNWAINYNLPVAIHSRNATQELIQIIREEKFFNLRGIFHCFSGDESEARELLDLGFYLGIGGVITYKNSGLPQVIATIGIDKLVLETDAPYLPPVPHRGKRNETSYIPVIAEKLSQIFNLSVEEIAKITTNNSKEIFGI